MPYTLGQAALAVGKSKPTISRAIQSGKLSANRQEDGSFSIDPAELHRVFLPVTGDGTETVDMWREETHRNAKALQDMLEVLQVERDRERRQLEGVIDDLRHRLDEESQERRKLVMLLTHQPEQANRPVPRWRNGRMWALIALCVIIALVAILWPREARQTIPHAPPAQDQWKPDSGG